VLSDFFHQFYARNDSALNKNSWFKEQRLQEEAQKGFPNVSLDSDIVKARIIVLFQQKSWDYIIPHPTPNILIHMIFMSLAHQLFNLCTKLMQALKHLSIERKSCDVDIS
jgi:hypothetical protein